MLSLAVAPWLNRSRRARGKPLFAKIAHSFFRPGLHCLPRLDPTISLALTLLHPKPGVQPIARYARRKLTHRQLVPKRSPDIPGRRSQRYYSRASPADALHAVSRVTFREGVAVGLLMGGVPHSRAPPRLPNISITAAIRGQDDLGSKSIILFHQGKILSLSNDNSKFVDCIFIDRQSSD